MEPVEMPHDYRGCGAQRRARGVCGRAATWHIIVNGLPGLACDKHYARAHSLIQSAHPMDAACNTASSVWVPDGPCVKTPQ